MCIYYDCQLHGARSASRQAHTAAHRQLERSSRPLAGQVSKAALSVRALPNVEGPASVAAHTAMVALVMVTRGRTHRSGYGLCAPGVPTELRGPSDGANIRGERGERERERAVVSLLS